MSQLHSTLDTPVIITSSASGIGQELALEETRVSVSLLCPGDVA